MRYADDSEAKLGDRVVIDGKHRGVVVANLDGGEYSEEYPETQWGYLRSGILIDTDFGGLVHYDGTTERIELERRGT